ncbi:MAG: hypothetical protein IAC58_00925 [Firmicutes bacterium]|uniref:Uncharacterized protein n=1 Tax=Candidatus Onthovivens merdipullorum TaxID=2840889 RepID=A0A9D9DII0_9BACL|nr:hypothetical protein [Candidatus Onthovivens merdipullorum]
MENLEEYINKHSANLEKRSDFTTYLYYLLDKYKIDNVTLYKKANISRQSYSLMISNKVNPSLNSLIKIIFTLKLTNHEAKYLLKKANYTLSSSSNYSLIIRYFIENKIYNLKSLNDSLIRYGYRSRTIE